MDKQTLSNYGWVVITVLVLAVMIAMATPFGGYIKEAVWSTTEGLFDTQQNAFGATGLIDTTEYIEITSEDQMYALGRLLASDSAKSRYITADASYNVADDFAMFNIPETCTTDAEKIDYLASAPYKLTTNINLVYDRATGNYFMGIGSSSHYFTGTFNGNGKTITLSQNGKTGFNAYTGSYIGLFNRTQNATIKNTNVKVNSDIIFTDTYGAGSLGGIVALAIDTDVSNSTFDVSNATFGFELNGADASSTFVWVGGVVSNIEGVSNVTNCTTKLTNATMTIDDNSNQSNTIACIGGVVSRLKTSDERRTITNCNLVAENSNILNSTSGRGHTGGIVGDASMVDISNCTTTLNDSLIKSYGDTVNTTAQYATLSTGGIIGFSQNGSSNSANIGRIGNQMTNCHLIVKNTTNADTIVSMAEYGAELCSGGLVGCSFNNFVAKNSTANITNGNIIAVKTGSTDTSSTYGTQAGGIIGRLEHTGEINGCAVTGNNMMILSKSPHNQSSAGGIVGEDVGPHHRNITTINSCSFNGSGNSNIKVQITSIDNVQDKYIGAGGIVGNGTYKINNCSVKNVTITNVSSGVAESFIGKIVGRYADDRGHWLTGDYFEPDAPEITNCSSSNVILNCSDNVSQRP